LEEGAKKRQTIEYKKKTLIAIEQNKLGGLNDGIKLTDHIPRARARPSYHLGNPSHEGTRKSNIPELLRASVVSN